MSRYYCEDSRRLTGANLYSGYPGAVLDLVVKNENDAGEQADKLIVDLDTVASAWTKHAQLLLQALTWHTEKTSCRHYDNGVSLGITAPVDCLYSAVDLCESALLLAGRDLNMGTITGIEIQVEAGFEALVLHLKDSVKEECNPALIALASAAASHNTLFLFDDDEVSLGSGTNCRQWPVDQIPEVDSINWDTFSSIPLALVTGTNGKSTSVRLAASIAHTAGLNAGTTSTDYIKAGNTIIDKGDYSGPGGARTLMRNERVEIAILELARGGLLRRGLGVPEADTALITNVAADHLGEYGINTVPDLIEVKFIVQKALSASSPLVLNADDAGIVKYAQRLVQTIVWFSEDRENKVILDHLDAGGEVVTVEGQQLVHIRDGQSTAIVEINEIPITMNGVARHNVQNALGVVALSCVLGIDYPHIKQGLLNFSGSVEENPGRGNFFEANGVKILIDFAHNEHGMMALASTAANIPSTRRLLLLGQAGDRSDEAIGDLVKAAMTASPDQIIVSETPGYERGRETHETSDIIVTAIKTTGFPGKNISRTDNPVTGVQMALDWAKPGDLLLLFILTNRNEAISIVKDYISH